ncbi:hypothetical protein RUM43_005366 [Polyplax serrata]|uniref:HIT-type domain-containing protein n=1 Tax=Polyplax serrata TaxID=468196 RepID=A0AAN8S2U9_POLSC
MTGGKCQICEINTGKYLCPRCDIRYCSVKCYQSEEHLQCSEAFYEKLVKEELQCTELDPEVKKRMIESLKNTYQRSLDEESLDDADSEPDLASRLSDLNLDDVDAIWEKLTPSERKDFRKLVATGEIIKILPAWEPWWIVKRKNMLIQECDSEEFNCQEICPKICSTIPKLATLTKIEPSPKVPNMLLNILAAYSCTVRWFKGVHMEMPVEAISTCIALSATLRINQLFNNALEAFLSFEDDFSKCQWLKEMEFDRTTINADLKDIIQGQFQNDVFFCIKAALSDLGELVTKSIQCLKNSKTVHLKSKCPKGSTSVTYTDDLKLLAVGQEDGSILLFEKDSEPRVLLDYDMNQFGEACTDLKIKSSPKGGYNKTVLAGYLSGHIKLWDTTIGKVLFTLKEDRHLYSLNYHPRSHRFVSVGNDFKVNIYDEERRVTERVLASSGIKGCKKGHTASVCSAVFHPKNPFELISGGIDNMLQFWDIRAPYAIRNIEGITMYGDALDVTEDGKLVLCGLSGSWDSPVQVFDYNTGKLLKQHKRSGCFIYCCKFLSPVYVGLGGFYQHTFRIINMKTAQVCGYISGLPGCVMSFAPCKKVPRFKMHPENMPRLAISAGDRVLEVDFTHPEGAYDSPSFYYESLIQKNSNEIEILRKPVPTHP